MVGYLIGDADFTGAKFIVINNNADDTPPVVNGVTVDKTQANPGDQVTVSIDASDNQSGVAIVSINYRTYTYQYMNAQAVYNPATKKYEATISVTK